ncbi:hypothetical protein BpHYR1_017568 [Brachionus plicatilis]|uniref:Uncharacterized protein n=1 Tax=Brachionus plicatilis TaxID=10195 RepID=A0A3M7RX53_BRAPC|nr:hypothetical protein BpHYR1_017568 [Brachionus plicatilis]
MTFKFQKNIDNKFIIVRDHFLNKSVQINKIKFLIFSWSFYLKLNKNSTNLQHHAQNATQVALEFCQTECRDHLILAKRIFLISIK